MTWLEANGGDAKPAGERLRELIDKPEILGVPGAHNGLAGMLARDAGFEALYISGGAVTASLGLPDLGVMTLEELCFVTRMVSRSTDLPLIVDGDTGYGEVLNAMRVVKELEHAGAGAVHIEDQILPKKCGHLNDKRLTTPEAAVSMSRPGLTKFACPSSLLDRREGNAESRCTRPTPSSRSPCRIQNELRPPAKLGLSRIASKPCAVPSVWLLSPDENSRLKRGRHQSMSTDASRKNMCAEMSTSRPASGFRVSRPNA